MPYRNILYIIAIFFVFSVFSYAWVTWCIEPLLKTVADWRTSLSKMDSSDTIKRTSQKLDHSIKHLAIIMDGNRRWAKKQGLAAWIGHQNGVNPVKMTVEFCIEQGIKHLSLYAFSLENLQRSPEELDHLFEIIEKSLTNEDFEKLYKYGVKVTIIGLSELFPERLIAIFNDIQEKTKQGTELMLNISFCYGGQQELTDTMKRLGTKIKQQLLDPHDITPAVIQEHLWTSHSPNPDLIIRTGGHKRLSNFLPWQSTYSELLFLDKYWPDTTKEDLYDAVLNFNTIQRNFGT